MNDSSSFAKVVTWLFLICVGLGVTPAEGQFGEFKVLNPKTYRAPAGRYVLTIDPSDRHGRGEATYRCQQNGQEKWSEKLPFTLWDAAITDDGIVAGYGYTNGPNSISDSGDFLVVILDHNGEIRLKDAIKRELSRFLHDSPDPKASGLIVDGPNDRMVVRVEDPDVNRAWESWWVYNLSTATEVEKLVPVNLMADPKSTRFILDAKPVPNTPLTLVHWWRYDEKQRGSVGARFTLIDLKAKPVWELDLPNDYTVPGDEKGQDKLRDQIRQRGAILRCDEPGRFDIFIAATSMRKTFSVSNDSGTWKVQEVATNPHDFMSTSKPAPLAMPEQLLTYLGAVELKSNARSPQSPIREVRTFTFNGDGHIAFLRTDDAAKSPVFVQVDQTGRLLHEIPVTIKVKPDDQWTACVWVGGSRFVLTNSDAGLKSKSRAWWLDTKTQKFSEITGFDCPPVQRLIGFSDGGFVAFATMRFKYTSASSLIAFDQRGQRVWELTDDYNRKGKDELFGVKDITRTSGDEIVVLENVGNKVKCFNRQGHLQRQFVLEKSWNREPTYPASIASDREGGFIVEDFHGSPPYIRMKPDGTVRSEFTPKYADGRVVDSSDGVQAAPDGRLWTCDGNCVVRLTDAGIVDSILGHAPQVNELTQIAGIAVDRKSQIYAVDARTGSIHAFDSQGSLRHVCQALPADFPKAVFQPALSINDQGEVFLGLGDAHSLRDRERQFARFSGNGQRLTNATMPYKHCFFQPVTNNIVAEDLDQIHLMSQLGKVTHTISRKPNRNWIESLRGIALGADGSLAGLSWNSVDLYESNGDPIRTILLPEIVGRFPRFAYDGAHLVIAGDCKLCILDRSGALLGVFKAAEWKDPQKESWEPFLFAGGKELLLFDEKTKIFHRYKMP